MRRLNKQQWLEQTIYLILWIAVFLFPLLGGYFALNGGVEKAEVYDMLYFSWLGILPFWGLFLINNYVLVPFLLFKKRYWRYAVSLLLVAGFICCFIPLPVQAPFEKGKMEDCRISVNAFREDPIGKQKTKEPDRHPRPFMKRAPFPQFILRYAVHIVTAFLMVGFNIAVKLFFKSVRDDELLKDLDNQRLQNELQYLKYQINPHFFMNTLNNIHALVDIDTGKAKSSIVEFSKLMRYVLYEASNKTIQLSREIQFVENYIALMSLRFTDKVSIKVFLPDEVPEVQIPPLLFISFIENAFKHGVSYRKESFVHVGIQLEEGNLISFRCTNSCGRETVGEHHGIGLENIRKRLKLLFGNDYTLSIKNEKEKFDVLLIVPLLS